MRRCIAALLLVAAMPLPALAGDPVAGEAAFRVCSACHRVGPQARDVVGPELNGLIGRKAGTADGFAYSAAMKASGIVWDEAALLSFIKAPRQTVPGTRMTFGGVADDAKAADLVAFLATFAADGSRKSP